jgi:hypothetical protein
MQRTALIPVAAHAATIRVALANLRWPLDPALVVTRDESTVARAVFATPLRTDASGRVTTGLCSAWTSSDGFRTWTFRCTHALEIAAELRRVAAMRASQARWLFAPARTIAVPSPGRLVVRLVTPWRRFPYALTAVAAAPRNVPGPFRVVHAARDRLELARGKTTLVFRRLSAYQAVQAYSRHEVDEAPVPLGDLEYVRGRLRDVRVRRLLAQDVVVFRSARIPVDLRRAYWDTANRGDYQALVAQKGAAVALALVGSPKLDPGAFRRAVGRIAKLTPMPVTIGVPRDPTLQLGARLLLGQWREVGLSPRLVAASAGADAQFARVLAPYPQDEALLGAVGFTAGRAARDQDAIFAALDARNNATATIVPVCWVADARLVSPSLVGWHEDVLGNVDYTVVARK